MGILKILVSFKEMRQKGFTPTVEAYCGMIQVAKTWEEAMFYLKDAASRLVKPNIGIFNALIEKAISTVSFRFRSVYFVLNMLS